MVEIWKDVLGYEERYQVSNLGRIRSKDIILNKSNGRKEFKKGKIIKLQQNIHGYPTHLFSNGTNRKLITIHRVVALTFIPNPEGKPNVDHINTIRTDNRVENLRWVTQSENNRNPITMTRYRKKGDYNHSEETKRKISTIQKCRKVKPSTIEKRRLSARPVSQYTMDGIFIKHFASASFARDEIGNICVSHIGSCCRGLRKSAGGFRWIYKKDFKEGYILPPRLIERKKGIATEKQKNAARKSLAKARESTQKRIIQIDSNNNYMKIFKSLSEASRELGVDVGSISRCCQGKYKHTKGFKFKYYDKQ